MPVTKVSSIHIYPIKSTGGISVTQAKVEELGLEFDRRFIVSDPSGQFITARTEPSLCLVQAKLINHGITLSAPNMPTLNLEYKDSTARYQEVTVWGDKVSGQLCAKQVNEWFSKYLNRPCHLFFFGQNSHRERKSNTANARKLAFADGYPLLLISQASLNQLNDKLLSNQQPSVSMAQFRPNIVINNCLPFAEDGWQHIRIGEVEFKVSKPCERCVFTTINPQNGQKNDQQEPLKTLKSFRKTQDGEILFGQNLIAINEGDIYQGDKLTVISKKTPPIFILPDSKTNIKSSASTSNERNTDVKPVNLKLSILFEKWNKTYQIPSSSKKTTDKEKTLLENGEDAGLIIPYSCRAGMCGRCKAKLISGNVIQSSTDGLTEQEKEDGYILCCSAVATSDVAIKHD